MPLPPVRRNLPRMTETQTAPRIVIPYFTGSGHARRVAEAVAEGAGGAQPVDVTAMAAADWRALDAAEAIVFGTPTYMGSAAARFDLFLEGASDRWAELLWKDKIAAGFTVATCPSGDKLAALMRLAIHAAQMGMLWIGQAEIGMPVNPAKPGINRDGSWLGLMAGSTRGDGALARPEDLETARRFGARIAAAVRRWRV